jgi:hypothetical protein
MDLGSAWIEKVPESLKVEIDDLKAKIISGEVSASYPRETP